MSIRHLQLAFVAAAAAALAACGSMPPYGASAPQASYPQSTYPQASVGNAPMSQEYGRITSIEQVAAATSTGSRPPNIVGAVVGGVAGAVLGHQVGGGGGRDAATVLGGVAGAAIGSQVGRGAAPPPATSPSGYVYRVGVQTDQGLLRQYEVSATGDLRVGDRVRIDNGVIYRY